MYSICNVVVARWCHGGKFMVIVLWRKNPIDEVGLTALGGAL
jgi:hypothetical protein